MILHSQTLPAVHTSLTQLMIAAQPANFCGEFLCDGCLLLLQMLNRACQSHCGPVLSCCLYTDPPSELRGGLASKVCSPCEVRNMRSMRPPCPVSANMPIISDRISCTTVQHYQICSSALHPTNLSYILNLSHSMAIFRTLESGNRTSWKFC